MRMFRVGNVMENAGRESHIEGAVLMRDFASREHRVLLWSRKSLLAQLDAACGRVRAGQLRGREIPPEEGDRIADSGSKVQNPHGACLVLLCETGKFGDLIGREKLGAFACDCDIRSMPNLILIGKAVKFSTIHYFARYRLSVGERRHARVTEESTKAAKLQLFTSSYPRRKPLRRRNFKGAAEE
jgi:hypothetical protein